MGIDFGQDKIPNMGSNICNRLLASRSWFEGNKQVFVCCLPCIIVMDFTDWSKHIQEQFWEHPVYILIHEYAYSMDKDFFDRKNIKFQIQVISTSARRYTSNDTYCSVLQDQDMF